MLLILPSDCLVTWLKPVGPMSPGPRPEGLHGAGPGGHMAPSVKQYHNLIAQKSRISFGKPRNLIGNSIIDPDQWLI